MKILFDSEKYLQLLQQQIRERADHTSGKLYIEINGKLLKDDFASRIFPGYEADLKKKFINLIKNDADILVCVNANLIIENAPMTKKEIPCQQHIELTLKRIETATGIRPQLVITHINVEEMYDIVFSFESRFQKKGYKIWEHYVQKGFPINKTHLLSEHGFWANDHIPIFKKIALVTGIGEESGKLAACLSQIFLDHQIGIESSFCMFQTLPINELAASNPINQAWLSKRTHENLTQDDLGETVEESSQESFQIIKSLLADQVSEQNLINQYQKVSEMIVCPTLECITDLASVEALAQKELSS